ncbi:hypothetical protein N7449_004383 [Penicillium cf. viridicatum]|uniref:NADP-dependent oxidoreductase domain-containing protein n=1 Tax=Penicillium cf. viridicatum TaxID=2972119 RepID=A0A9W9MJ72_9EURO|nr:hypothetical protein N7449_004383 [Penicillium cf. viridicatum]
MSAMHQASPLQDFMEPGMVDIEVMAVGVNFKGCCHDNLSRKHIFESIDASLKRLDLPYVDLLQIHRFDPRTPHTARIHGWTEFISMQNLHNAIYREEEREMYPACAKFGMGGIPWSPIAMGFLARPWRDFSTTTRGEGQGQGFLARPWRDFSTTTRGEGQGQGFLGQSTTEADKNVNEQVEKIAKQHGVSMATVAIAWSLSKSFITAPILGMSKKERVNEAVRAISFELTPEELKRIDELYEPKKVIGHQ